MQKNAVFFWKTLEKSPQRWARAAPAQNEWGERGQNKKFETYDYNIRSLWHTKNSISFSTPLPGALPL